MDRKAFQKALTRALYPRLKQAGFRGTGSTRRRTQAPVIHVVNVQGSQWGRGCYVNLGVHLRGLSTAGDGPPMDEPMEYHCTFRTRLQPPPALEPGIWPYGDTEAAAQNTAEVLAHEFELRGEAFFSQFSRWPDDFRAAVTSAATGGDAHGLTMIRLAQHLGMHDEAGLLATTAMSHASPEATRLRAALQEVLSSLGGPTRR